MTPEAAGERPIEARLGERAAEAGIAIAPERLADVAAGARRLEAAAERVRRFLADPADPAARP